MGFITKVRERLKMRAVRKIAEEELKRIEAAEVSKIEFSDLLRNHGVSSSPAPETQEQHEVTGAYQTVVAMMQEVIENKKKGRAAARRITDSIGAPPETQRRRK